MWFLILLGIVVVCALAYKNRVTLLAKMLGLPGKTEVSGEQVYPMHLEGKLREINDYCMFDTLDTYFVFLRTRVLLGEMPSEVEQMIARRARVWLGAKAEEVPALRRYLEVWDRLHP